MMQLKKALLDELKKLIVSPAYKINTGWDKMLIIVRAE